MSVGLTTVHVVREGSEGVRIPPAKRNDMERHLVVEYGKNLRGLPLMIGTAYIHDWPETTFESNWLDDHLRPRMTSRMDIRDAGAAPLMPTVPHLRAAG